MNEIGVSCEEKFKLGGERVVADHLIPGRSVALGTRKIPTGYPRVPKNARNSTRQQPAK
jgi:hypothetical protein